MDDSNDEQGPLNHWEEIFNASRNARTEDFAEILRPSYQFSEEDFACFLPKKADVKKFAKETNAQLENLENLQKKQNAKQKPKQRKEKKEKVDFGFQPPTDKLQQDVLEMMEISQRRVAEHMADPENVAWLKAAAQNQKDIVEYIGKGIEKYWDDSQSQEENSISQNEWSDCEFEEDSGQESDWQDRVEELPKNADPLILKELKGYISSEFEGEILSKQDEARLTALSYNATKIVQKHPELYKVELASAGALRALPSIARFCFDKVAQHYKADVFKHLGDIFEKDIHSKKEKLKQQNQIHSKFEIPNKDENGPSILSTPNIERKGTTLSTPILKLSEQKLSQLPGFEILNDLQRFKDAGFEIPHPKNIFQDKGFDIHETSWEDALLFRKKYLDTVEKVNGRRPINGDFAGQKYPLERLSGYLQAEFPGSVCFDEKGFARLEPYSKLSLQIEGLTGDHRLDNRLADKAAGFTKRPSNMTWHHVEDGKTMLLVPKDLHKAVPHTGGAAILNGKKK